MQTIGPYEGKIPLVGELDRLLQGADAMLDMINRVQFALNIDATNIKTAGKIPNNIGFDSNSHGDQSITFYVDDTTIMMTVTRTNEAHTITGWVAPPGQYTVQVRVAGHGSTYSTTDDDGRFTITEAPPGTTQFLVHLNGDTPPAIATPAVIL